MSNGITIGRILGLPAITWLGLLYIVSASPYLAQTPPGVARFRVEWAGYDNNIGRGVFTVGVMTVSAAGVSFEANDGSPGFEFPLEEILQVKKADPLRILMFGTSIDKHLHIELRKRKGGYSNRNYNLYVKDDNGHGAQVGPVIQAITAAMKAQQATGGRPATPSPENQVPPPPTASAIVIVGQTPDQVKTTLGQPDRIDPPSSSSKVSNQIVWFYRSLTVTFVDGKVSSVQQVRP
jgi:hypothetical protein